MRRPPVFLAAALAAAFPAAGQVSYKSVTMISAEQRVLPATGPGSSLRNPAALAETRLAYVQYGRFYTASGKSVVGFRQASVTLPTSLWPALPVAFSAGLGATGNDTKIDNSNSIHRVAAWSPGVAVSWPASRDRKHSLALGLATTFSRYNVFGALKTTSTDLDLGILATFSPRGHLLRTGTAWHNLVRPEIELPDRPFPYRADGWIEWSLAWASPGRMFNLYWERYFLEIDGSAPGGGSSRDGVTGVSGWEVEFRPIPWVGVKWEKTRDAGFSSVGTILRPTFGRLGLFLEWCVGHDKFPAGPEWLIGKTVDEGRGFLYSATLGADL